jgi:hypothetical protein
VVMAIMAVISHGNSDFEFVKLGNTGFSVSCTGNRVCTLSELHTRGLPTTYLHWCVRPPFELT